VSSEKLGESVWPVSFEELIIMKVDQSSGKKSFSLLSTILTLKLSHLVLLMFVTVQ